MPPDMRDVFQSAKALENARDWAAAERIYGQVISGTNGKLLHQAYRRRTECRMRLQKWVGARKDVDAVFAAGILLNNRDIKRRVSVYSHLGETKIAADTIAERVKFCVSDYPEPDKNGLIILTAAAPKTGSTSLSTALAAAMGWPKINYLCYQNPELAQGFPSLDALDILKGRGIVNHCHLAPDDELLAELEKRPWVKVAVHFRHPVETMLSTLDLVMRQNSPLILSQAPHLVGAPEAEIRDWVFSVYARQLSGWMQHWLGHVDAGHPSILCFTTLDQIKTLGQDNVARDVLIEAHLSPKTNATTEPQRTAQRLTGKQKVAYQFDEREQVLAHFPKTMLERFNWY
jgi:hypothetical protein